MENNNNLPENSVTLDLLPKDGERVLYELKDGNMVIFRSKNDFLYSMEFNGQYHMFSHTPGAQGGGQRQFPVDDKYRTSVRKLADLADSVYLCIFDKSMNIYGVLQSAEDGILSMFPSDDSENNETVEFAPWDKNRDESNEKSQRVPQDGPAGSDFPSEHFDDLLKF